MADENTKPIEGVILYLGVEIHRDPSGGAYCLLDSGTARHIGHNLMRAADDFDQSLPPRGGPVRFPGSGALGRRVVAAIYGESASPGGGGQKEAPEADEGRP